MDEIILDILHSAMLIQIWLIITDLDIVLDANLQFPLPKSSQTLINSSISNLSICVATAVEVWIGSMVSCLVMNLSTVIVIVELKVFVKR